MTYTSFEDASIDQRRHLVEDALRQTRHARTLMASAEAINVLTVGGSSQDLSTPSAPLPPNAITWHDANDLVPALSSAAGLGAFRSIKPDYLAPAGEHEVRAFADGAGVRLRVVDRTQRTGLNVATFAQGAPTINRSRGTSCATALASRASLTALAALTEADGPYAGQNLAPRDKALIAKALSVNAAIWPTAAERLFEVEMRRLNGNHNQAREEVCRYYGHGLLDDALMRASPGAGATLIGLGTVRKDKAAIFNVPLPPSLAGQRMGRAMRVTIAWFSPTRPTRAQYRLALLEAVSHGSDLLGDLVKDDGWVLALRAGHLDSNLIKRGTVWSRRLVHNGLTVPGYVEGAVLPIRVQCRDSANGGLDRTDDIRFALAVTLEIEAEAEFDIYAEIQDRLRIQLRGIG